MDANDAEVRIAGSVAIGRELGARRRFWALLLVHTLLTGACIACFVYTLSNLNSPPPSPLLPKGIYLNMKKDLTKDNTKLRFTVTWNNNLELNQESEVSVKFPGPYIFYICAKVTGDDGGSGTLTLEQKQTKIPIILPAQPEKNTNRWVRHERLVSLYENYTVTFHFSNPDAEEKPIILEDLRVGLQYMLGELHFKTPSE